MRRERLPSSFLATRGFTARNSSARALPSLNLKDTMTSFIDFYEVAQETRSKFFHTHPPPLKMGVR